MEDVSGYFDPPFIVIYDPHDSWGLIASDIASLFNAENPEMTGSFALSHTRTNSSDGFGAGPIPVLKAEFAKYRTLEDFVGSNAVDDRNCYTHLFIANIEKYGKKRDAEEEAHRWLRVVRPHNTAAIILVHRFLVHRRPSDITGTPPTASIVPMWSFGSQRTDADKAESLMRGFESKFKDFSVPVVRFHEVQTPNGVLRLVREAHDKVESMLRSQIRSLFQIIGTAMWSLPEYWIVCERRVLNALRFGMLEQASRMAAEFLYERFVQLDAEPLFRAEGVVLQLCNSPNMFQCARTRRFALGTDFFHHHRLECIVYIVGIRMLLLMWIDHRREAIRQFQWLHAMCLRKIESEDTLPRDIVLYFLYSASLAAVEFIRTVELEPRPVEILAPEDATGSTPTGDQEASKTLDFISEQLSHVRESLLHSKLRHRRTRSDMDLVAQYDQYKIDVGDVTIRTMEYFVALAELSGHTIEESCIKLSNRLGVPTLASRETFLRHYMDLALVAADAFKSAGRHRCEVVQRWHYVRALVKRDPKLAAQTVLKDILPHFKGCDWPSLSLKARKLYIGCLDTFPQEEVLSYATHCICIALNSPQVGERELYLRKMVKIAENTQHVARLDLFPLFSDVVTRCVSAQPHPGNVAIHHVGGEAGPAVLPITANIDEAVLLDLSMTCPVDVSELAEVNVVLASRRNWSNLSERLHELEVKNFTLKYLAPLSVLMASAKITPCHTGDYCLHQIQIVIGNLIFEWSWDCSDDQRGQLPLSTDASPTKTDDFVADPLAPDLDDDGASGGSDAGPGPATNIILHVPEPEIGLSLAVEHQGHEGHCFECANDQFFDVLINIESDKPLVVQQKKQFECVGCSFNSVVHVPAVPSFAQVLDTMDDLTKSDLVGRILVGKLGKRGTRASSLSGDEDINSKSTCSFHTDEPPRIDELTTNLVEIANAESAAADGSPQRRSVPDPLKRSFDAAPSSAHHSPHNRRSTAPFGLESVCIGGSDAAATCETKIPPSNPMRCMASLPPPEIQTNAGGASTLMLKTRAGQTESGLFAFDVVLSDEKASEEVKDALLRATAIRCRIPLLPQFYRDSPVDVTFCCCRDRETCYRSIPVSFPFTPAFSCSYTFHSYRGSVFCSVSIRCNLRETPLRIHSAELVLLGDSAAFEIIPFTPFEFLMKRPLGFGDQSNIIFMLKELEGYNSETEVECHTARIVLSYRRDQEACSEPNKYLGPVATFRSRHQYLLSALLLLRARPTPLTAGCAIQEATTKVTHGEWFPVGVPITFDIFFEPNTKRWASESEVSSSAEKVQSHSLILETISEQNYWMTLGYKTRYITVPMDQKSTVSIVLVPLRTGSLPMPSIALYRAGPATEEDSPFFPESPGARVPVPTDVILGRETIRVGPR